MQASHPGNTGRYVRASREPAHFASQLAAEQGHRAHRILPGFPHGKHLRQEMPGKESLVKIADLRLDADINPYKNALLLPPACSAP